MPAFVSHQQQASRPTTVTAQQNSIVQPKLAVSPPPSVSENVSAEAKPNNTGLPDNLKTGIENLSGLAMDDVKVHYNSPKPAQLQAYAYAQGTDIHLGAGQEKHLPHEAWHVVQQKQGRVSPTLQMKGASINDDKGLEREADEMGAKAAIAVNMSYLSGIFQRRTESAEAHTLLDPTSGQGEIPITSDGIAQRKTNAFGTTSVVQCYTKIKDNRVSDNKDMVVEDAKPHNHAYATVAEINAGNSRLRNSGSHVKLTVGAVLEPDKIGLEHKDVHANLFQVIAKPFIPLGESKDAKNKQNDESIVIAQLYEAIARNVLATLQKDSHVVDKQKLIEEMETEAVKKKITEMQSKMSNRNPANIALWAEKCGLEPKYVRLIMEEVIHYQNQIKAEINGGGFTTTSDCGQTASLFVRGGDVQIHRLTPEQKKAKGYNYHFFAMVLEDGKDKISLENAVGSSRFEQLWKSAIFDSMWHFEMRGENVDLQDLGDEEMHKVGEDSNAGVKESEVAINKLNEARKALKYTIADTTPELTKSPDEEANKNGYKELTNLSSPVNYEREQALIIAGIAYANAHIRDKKSGGSSRILGWRNAAKEVIKRGGPNLPLARHLEARANLVGKKWY